MIEWCGPVEFTRVALVHLKRLTWVHLTFEIAKNNFFFVTFTVDELKMSPFVLVVMRERHRASTLPLS